jgi:hypothetical protein
MAVGVWQVESGIDYTRDGGSDRNSRNYSLPAAEIRVGVLDGAELYLNSLNWTRQENDRGTNRGFQDFKVGTKFRTTTGDFASAVLAEVLIPAGDDAFTADRWDPAVAYAWLHNPSSIAGMARVRRIKNGVQFDNAFKWSFAAGSAGSAFLEWEANLPEGGDDAHWLNLGYTLSGVAGMQLDANAGVALNDAAGDYRLGVGFSYRF